MPPMQPQAPDGEAVKFLRQKLGFPGAAQVHL
jgi:hypothetical protein